MTVPAVRREQQGDAPDLPRPEAPNRHIRSKAGKESFDKYIDRLEDSIIEYGTVVECGNETINIVLTEKNILCSTCGVKFSYLIDGSIFGFMSEMELFSLFGNALDKPWRAAIR